MDFSKQYPLIFLKKSESLYFHESETVCLRYNLSESGTGKIWITSKFCEKWVEHVSKVSKLYTRRDNLGNFQVKTLLWQQILFNG